MCLAVYLPGLPLDRGLTCELTWQALTQDRSIPMTNEAISPLRRRMIEDMTIRKLSPKTQQGYIRTIKNLAAFLGRSPDKASFEDVRRFQLHGSISLSSSMSLPKSFGPTP